MMGQLLPNGCVGRARKSNACLHSSARTRIRYNANVNQTLADTQGDRPSYLAKARSHDFSRGRLRKYNLFFEGKQPKILLAGYE
jgi:hypothetical protein